MSMLLICLFGGWFGLHKFIEKKTAIGVLYVFTFGLFGIGWIIDSIIYLTKWLKTDKPKQTTEKIEPDNIAETVAEKEEEKVEESQKQEIEPITEEEFNRLKNMCCDIHKEYKELLKGYKDADIDGKVYILKECHRKLSVIESTVYKHKCYYDINIYDELEKIEKKAKTFINTYIRDQREAGYDDYMIDVTQFDLDFISDYIYEKDTKLNKI